MKQFSALEKPPQTPAGAPGIRLVLIGKGASSLSAGDPIVFKGYTVGRIEDLTFDVDNKNMRYDIFIDGRYDKLIDSSVRFWNISGISISTNTAGLKNSTGSLQTIIAGGIAVGKPPNSKPGQAMQDNDEFILYGNEEDTLETEFSNRTYYVAEFTQSLYLQSKQVSSTSFKIH